MNSRLELPIVVVSPHFDDAVLSCGRVLAVTSAVVATFFAGTPPAGTPLTPWDQAAGFATGDDQIGLRAAEDDAALKVLGATARRFSFIDAQYRDGPAPVAEMTDALGDLLDCVHPRSVLLPAGNGHADHLACLQAGLSLLPTRSTISWFIYEDGTYRRGLPLPPERLLRDGTPGVVARPCAFPSDPEPELKRTAIACYRSQVHAFMHYRRRLLAEADIDEQYWRLELAPSAPSRLERGMAPSQRFTVNRPAIIDEIIDDEVVLVDLQRGIYFSIRGSGAAIWDLLVDSATVDEAILYVGAKDEAASLVAEFVAALEQESLVRGVRDQDLPSGSRPPLDVPFEPPVFERFTDMEDLLLLDPVHDVDEQGWPHLGAAT